MDQFEKLVTIEETFWFAKFRVTVMLAKIVRGFQACACSCQHKKGKEDLLSGNFGSLLSLVFFQQGILRDGALRNENDGIPWMKTSPRGPVRRVHQLVS